MARAKSPFPIFIKPPVYDSYTKLMLHLDNSISDSSSLVKPMTDVGVIFSPSIYKFGGYAGVFNGTNSYITTPHHDDFCFGASDFTIDAWIYSTDVSLPQTIVSKQNKDNISWCIYANNYGNPNYGVRFLFCREGENTQVDRDFPFTFSNNTWYHIAVVRASGNLKVYINGNSIGSQALTDNIRAGTRRVDVGGHEWTPFGMGNIWKGNIDELRISKGIARWTSNFTPPTSPY